MITKEELSKNRKVGNFIQVFREYPNGKVFGEKFKFDVDKNGDKKWIQTTLGMSFTDEKLVDMLKELANGINYKLTVYKSWDMKPVNNTFKGRKTTPSVKNDMEYLENSVRNMF